MRWNFTGLKKLLFLFLISLSAHENICSKVKSKDHLVDMIIFSYDRPIQLFALLESIEKYVIGIGEIYIIYRVSSDEYDKSYHECISSFSDLKIISIKQGLYPRSDFKPLTFECLINSKNQYVVFAVDDIIVKDYINLTECSSCIEKTQAHGFYLRLGTNIHKNYTIGIDTPIPFHTQINDYLYSWKFKDGLGDWGYPSTLDMTVYCKEKILPIITALDFSSPNLFEGAWAIKAIGLDGTIPLDLEKSGLFYKESKIVNIPLSIVQDDHLASKHMNYSKKDLLLQFKNGLKIDIAPFYKINNSAPHMELEPLFIKRKIKKNKHRSKKHKIKSEMDKKV